MNGAEAGQRRVEATQPMLLSGDETTDVGRDSATPVSEDYGPLDSKFSGAAVAPGRGAAGRVRGG